jgi:predicted  nucleic acid-binding Zn-ribbon protein
VSQRDFRRPRTALLFEEHMGLTEHREEARPQISSEQQEQEEERRKLRRLQVMMNMVMAVISQDQELTVEEAAELVANTKRAALAMFPDKEFAYDILYKPRLQRLMAERFRLQ